MDLDFIPDSRSLNIPQSAYRPIKKCPHCQSIYISDHACDTCGKSLDFELIGRPFSYKSTYSIKERYLESFGFFEKYFEFLENKNAKEFRSYKRNLEKRFKDLCIGFSTPGLILEEDRKFLYLEFKYLINEMVDLYYPFNFFHSHLESHLKNDLISRDLLTHLQQKLESRSSYQTNFEKFLVYKILGVLRVEFVLKTLTLSGVLLLLAIKFRYLIVS